MALIDDLIAATDPSSPAAVIAANAVIDAVNTTRAAIDAAVAAGDKAGSDAALAGEATTALGHLPVPTVAKAVTPVSGPAAVRGL